MQAHLDPTRVESIQSCMARFKLGRQAHRPLGGSFPGSSLGTAPYETISLVDKVPGYSSLLAVPLPTKSVRCLFPHPFSVVGSLFSSERSMYGGNLSSPNNKDGCFPLGMGSGFRGTTGLRCLVRQVPQLAHKWAGVESGSSSSHSLSSIPDALTCHRQDGQHGGGISHQSPGRLPVTHPKQACAPASSLGTGQVFVPESGSCPRGLEPSGGLLVKTEAQVRGMDAELPYGGSDLGKIQRGRNGPYLFCTSYLFCTFLFYCTFYSLFLFFFTYIYIYAPVLCYFYLNLIFFALSTERT